MIQFLFVSYENLRAEINSVKISIFQILKELKKSQHLSIEYSFIYQIHMNMYCFLLGFVCISYYERMFEKKTKVSVLFSRFL